MREGESEGVRERWRVVWEGNQQNMVRNIKVIPRVRECRRVRVEGGEGREGRE